MKVLKFGGTSVGDVNSICKTIEIIENQTENIVVVVSAFSKVTNQLTKISNLACQNDIEYLNELKELKERHIFVANQIIKNKNIDDTLVKINQIFDELNGLVKGVSLVKELTARTLDCILSFGERLSAFIISKAIKNAEYFNSCEMIKTDSKFNKAIVDFIETNELIIKKLKNVKSIPVVAGFIGSNSDGVITTLGRGGSDFSAAIYAAALNASILEIWTDVDAFMTADPTKVTNAYPIKHLTYAEAMELSHFGAKVIYTPTIQPTFEKKIPILIKNTFNPQSEGTLISEFSNEPINKPIKGISSIDHIALITVQGSGMLGITGTSMRLFSALAKYKINIILISQASSEYSISFAIIPDDMKIAEKAIQEEFYIEMMLQHSISYKSENELSILAIVGENMIKTPGISGNLFNSFGKNGINVVAIAQGSSELNISAVISRKSLIKALNVVHDGFFLSDSTVLNLFQVGVGNVGEKFLQQVVEQRDILMKEHNLKINIVGIAKSDKYIINEKGIDIKENFKDYLNQNGENYNIKNFITKIKDLNLNNSIFIDNTANKEISDCYEEVLNSYISVVTSNKIACSSEYENYLKLKQISQSRGVKFLYETNVGAGLPIIKTISDLIKSGDKIYKIEAVISGTLNYIFNVISKNIPLSEAINQAVAKGYSEPDPRIDLSGTDVLRKLLILSREAGYKIEKHDVTIKNFLPDICFNVETVSDFFEQVKLIDNQFENKRKQIDLQNKKWRYVAQLVNGKASIELIEVDEKHQFYNLEGSDNIIILYTQRYNKLPLVIKGSGAGADVTAMGVFADIIRIGNI